MMKSARGLAILGSCLIASATPVLGQTTIASNNTGATPSNGSFTVGQSFTTPSGSVFNSVTVALQTAAGANTGVAGSKLYLFSSAYNGAPSGLAGANSLGSATISGANGTYSFASSLTLDAGTQYFFYDDTPFSVGLSTANPYSGGITYAAATTSSSFTNYAADDLRFIVMAAAPEPTTWSLMIIGFGVVGSTLRRRKRVGALGSIRAIAA